MSINNNEGSLTLDACISVTSFMILMLFFVSLFPMFMAQNATGHALLETTQSLCVDNLAAEQIGEGDFSGIGGVLVKVTGVGSTTSPYAANIKWEDLKGNELSIVLKERFIAYLAADTEGAKELLQRYGVEDDIEGLDFSESYVSGGKLHVVLTYRFEDRFSVLRVKPFEVRQTACSTLWHKPAAN